MKNKLILLIAVVIGILAFWLSANYLANKEAELYAGAEKIRVMVATRDLPSGTVLQYEDLGQAEVFKANYGDNAFTLEEGERLIGKRLKYSVKKLSPILWSQVDMPRPRGSGLAPVVTRGKRALSIAISGAASVSGLVKPNDHVDILGTFTFPSRSNPLQTESVTLTLMQNVTVLATGTQIAGQQNAAGQSAPGGYSTVTFELAPREVELLVFAQQTRGQLYLSLRNSEDIYYEAELPSVNFDYLEAVLKELNEERQIDIRRTTP